MGIEFLNHIERDTNRFIEAAGATLPTAPVPSCPGWSAADLVWHLAEVQHFWAAIVSDRLQDPSHVDKQERPDGYQDLLDLMRNAGEALTTALHGADPKTRVWTWANDKSVQFILRRQAHEALIHRVDAELTLGPTEQSEVDAELAADGVDEMVNFFVAGDLPDWSTFTPDGRVVRIDLAGGRESWSLAFGRFAGTSPVTGKTYDLDAAQQTSSDTENVIRGQAPSLDLWLWGRGDANRLTVTGDPGLPARLRALAAEATQ